MISLGLLPHSKEYYEKKDERYIEGFIKEVEDTFYRIYYRRKREVACFAVIERKAKKMQTLKRLEKAINQRAVNFRIKVSEDEGTYVVYWK